MGYGMSNYGPTGNVPRTSTGSNFSTLREKVPSGYRKGMLQQFTPEQMQLFKQLFSNVEPGSYLSRLAGGDESLFNEMEAPAMRQFSALQGNLASRFSGMGSFGSRRSSGFQNTSNQAASDFAQDLQARRQALQRQAILDLMGLSEDLLQKRPYEQFLVPKQKRQSGLGSILGAGLGGIGGFFAGGPVGALQGASLGYGVGSQF